MAIATGIFAGITLISAFTGTRSESFENAIPTVNADCLTNRAFNDFADICTPNHQGCLVTTGWTTTACTQQAYAGSWFFGNAVQGSTNNYTEITFDHPIQRFGGRFSKNTTYAGGDISFFSADGTLLATMPMNLPGGCTWVWNGWDFGDGPAVQSITLQGSFNSPILFDALQIDPAPRQPGIDTCFAGTGDRLPCPCGNPGLLGRGCENSSGTGGAQLSSHGSASLQADTLSFTMVGGKPTGTSVLTQGSVDLTTGIAFGQGLRCASGVVKRMYVKSASGGSIHAPGPTDLSVSARSAAAGDTLSVGSARWYSVFYRDPIVLGNCPATSTFNVTQTQLVYWDT
jgi:hypothetical protein